MEQPNQKPDHPAPQAVHHELRTAENSAGYVLAKLRSMKESKPSLRLLDVGCGSGTISVTFAKVIPEGDVTGLDLKPEILPRARAVADLAGVKNIEFLNGDVYKLPFADNSFDITHCHQMLTHLKEPWSALREMMRVTKPGGMVAAREGDLETECVWPELSGLLKFHKFAADTMKAAGGSATGGRQLLSWALKAGVNRDQITVSYTTWSYDTPSDKESWGKSNECFQQNKKQVLMGILCSAQGLVGTVRGGRLRDIGVKAGFATEADLEEMAKAWEEWAKRDDSSLAMIHGEILIQK
jgi:2-polyprenyl-3-methyl-5-hydroxy-6-metoxy-1,4-benzoquinol methylase